MKQVLSRVNDWLQKILGGKNRSLIIQFDEQNAGFIGQESIATNYVRREGPNELLVFAPDLGASIRIILRGKGKALCNIFPCERFQRGVHIAGTVQLWHV